MRLLIIEDEVALAEPLKKNLELKGYAVDWVQDGKKGLSRMLLYRNDYDLVLLDLMLPGMTGSEITLAARAEGVTIPIIMVTGRSETEHKVDLLNKGADDYIIKPYAFDELLARITSLLRRPTLSQPVVLSVGPIEMDTSTRIVRKAGTEIPLTLKEFALLECFMRQPNKVLSREKLFDHVWDFNALTLSNVLDVHMKNLRKKLEDDGTKEHLFETVRGVGYRLIAGEEAY